MHLVNTHFHNYNDILPECKEYDKEPDTSGIDGNCRIKEDSHLVFYEGEKWTYHRL
jgi:hypothetical protein